VRTTVLAFYRHNALAYFRATVRVDPSSFLLPLASRLAPGARVLDVGCGSGRDLAWLKERGFRVRGLEGSPELAALAREHAGCEVEVADFTSYDFGRERCEALLLIGALVHLDKDAARSVLARTLPALAPQGLLLVSLKQGRGRRKAQDGRVFVLWSDWEARQAFGALGLEVVHAARQPSAVRSGEEWLGYVLRRCGTE
jgi:SAM-dependent methyltransferase